MINVMLITQKQYGFNNYSKQNILKIYRYAYELQKSIFANLEFIIEFI